MLGVKIVSINPQGQVYTVGRFWLQGDRVRFAPWDDPIMQGIAFDKVWNAADPQNMKGVRIKDGRPFLENLHLAYRGVVNASRLHEFTEVKP